MAEYLSTNFPVSGRANMAINPMRENTIPVAVLLDVMA